MRFMFILIFLLHIYSINCESQFLIKDRGNFNYYSARKVINFDIDLKSYYENTITIKNLTTKIESLRIEIHDISQCEVFYRAYTQDLEKINNDVKYIQDHNKRRQRRWVIPVIWAGLKYLGKFILADLAVSALTYTVKTTWDNTGIKSINVSTAEEMLHISESIREYQEEKQLLDEMQATKMRQYHEIRDLLSRAKMTHYQMTKKIIHIMHRNIRTAFYQVIDYQDFVKIVEKTNKELAPNRTLPDYSGNALFEFSKIITSKNTTHASVTLEIPIIGIEMYSLKEFIPIPYKSGNDTKIVDLNSAYFYKSKHNQAKIIPNTEIERCMSYENFTLCNSLTKLYLQDPDICMDLVIFKRDGNQCPIKIIENKDYYMVTSDMSIYCYTLNRTRFKIMCNSQDYIYEIHKSDEISFENECDVIDSSSEIIFNRTSESSIEITTSLIQPDFKVYDMILKNWTYNITSINKHNIKLLEIKRNIMDLNVKLEKIKNEETSGALMIIFNIMNFVATPFRLIIELVMKLGTIAQIILIMFVSPMIICLYYFSFKTKNKENEKQ